MTNPAMKIQTIKITNYKAFLGTHTIKADGKNLFIYGEIGSGKSSLYYALKDFFQSSIEDLDLEELKNAFLPEPQNGRVSIEVKVKPNKLGENRSKSYLLETGRNDTRETVDTSIRDANRLKSFLSYKHLLAIHYLKKNESINLFNLLVKGVLKHFKYPLTGNKELGELWAEVEASISQNTGRGYDINKKKADVNSAIKIFNEAFSELFKVDSPEYILKHANPILEYFKHHIDLDLQFPQVRPSEDYKAFYGAEVNVNLKFAGKQIEKPHLFLNEARLSAIAISIYLGMIKRHVQNIPCKVLFLDDIFIGFDIANRLPLLDILEAEFKDYQIFITTYDKPWFEYAQCILAQRSNWKTMEFYAQTCKGNTEIPIIFDDQDLITKAGIHLQQCDYKAAAVYTRSAFEKILRNHCATEEKTIVFKKHSKDYTTEDFWKVIKEDLPTQTVKDIETYRALVLNTFSHYNTERHEIKPELESAIKTVKQLRDSLN